MFVNLDKNSLENFSAKTPKTCFLRRANYNILKKRKNGEVFQKFICKYQNILSTQGYSMDIKCL